MSTTRVLTHESETPGLAAKIAWDDVRELLEWNRRQLDDEVLTRAHEIESRFQLNWWDCLIVAAAQAQVCALLLTEDLQDGANYGGVIARNPFKLARRRTSSGLHTVAQDCLAPPRPRAAAQVPEQVDCSV